MPKLNKQQTLDLVATTVAHVIAQSTDLFKKDKAPGFEEVLQHRIAAILAPKSGGGTSTKVNDEGEVYCNYFQKYMPADSFNTKLGKPNKDTGERTEGYKANSQPAEVILRKIKSLRAMVSRQVTINFMDKTIDADEMTEILERLDTMTEPKFIAADDVPTVADVIGLTTQDIWVVVDVAVEAEILRGTENECIDLWEKNPDSPYEVHTLKTYMDMYK